MSDLKVAEKVDGSVLDTSSADAAAVKPKKCKKTSFIFFLR